MTEPAFELRIIEDPSEKSTFRFRWYIYRKGDYDPRYPSLGTVDTGFSSSYKRAKRAAEKKLLRMSSAPKREYVLEYDDAGNPIS